MPETEVELHLTPDEARELHSTLEDLLENANGSPALERVYRTLGWCLLATSGGTGLTARLADFARNAETLEEYETARDHELGPILDGLERGENRDP